MARRALAGALTVAVATLGLFAAAASASPATVPLGTAASFAVLSGAAVTNTGASALTGDLGGSALTGFPPGTLTGTEHTADSAAAQADADVATAYTNAAGRPPDTLIAGDLSGATLTPGVYLSTAALGMAAGTTLTLNGQGDPNAVFIIQTPAALTTGAGTHVQLTGGVRACNVFWAIGAAATLGASSDLAGTMLVVAAITVGAGDTVNGRVLARDGAVNLDDDAVTNPQCPPGTLSNTAPTFAPFTIKLTGTKLTVPTAVGAWSVTDNRGTNAGYSVTAAASAPTVDGSVAAAGTGGSITLTPSTATAASGNAATTGPVAAAAQTLTTTAATIENAPPGTGQGEWDFAADSGSARSLQVVIAGNAAAGTYSSTLTFTTAAPAG